MNIYIYRIKRDYKAYPLSVKELVELFRPLTNEESMFEGVIIGVY